MHTHKNPSKTENMTHLITYFPWKKQIDKRFIKFLHLLFTFMKSIRCVRLIIKIRR